VLFFTLVKGSVRPKTFLFFILFSLAKIAFYNDSFLFLIGIATVAKENPKEIRRRFQACTATVCAAFIALVEILFSVISRFIKPALITFEISAFATAVITAKNLNFLISIYSLWFILSISAPH
jgi:hypothetical protein